MAGLYTKKNLGETQLNLKEAIQKLYNPGIEEDIRLFAFSSSLYSGISSGVSIDEPNEIVGLINESFTDNSGQIQNRTKILTNKFTFSSENVVFFGKISTNFNFDRRPFGSTNGAPVVVSRNGSIVSVKVKGEGTQYEVVNSNGQVVTTSATVQVYLRGKESGSESALVELVVNSDGTLSRTVPVVVVDGGLGYIEGEELEVIPQCQLTRFGQQETPELNKCKNYAQNLNRLYHRAYKVPTTLPETDIDYSDSTIGIEAVIEQSKYLYKTKQADDVGFFLYDESTSKWLYLGDFYDTQQEVGYSAQPLLEINRYDKLTSANISNLKSLNSRSYFFNYEDNFSIINSQGGSLLGSQLRSQSLDTESLKDTFKYLIQNSKRQRLSTDEKNTLGFRYNIFEGKNFDSTFRLILRDPDGVLDKSSVTFSMLGELEDADEVEVVDGASTYHAPGLYIDVGGKYKRAYSTDDKPFLSFKSTKYISPLIHKHTTGSFQDSNNYTELSSSGEYKYSLSTAYLSATGEKLVGFDSYIGTLIQNLSSVQGNGGFVIHRPITTPTIKTATVANANKAITGWPLFSYFFDGSARHPHLLGYIL